MSSGTRARAPAQQGRRNASSGTGSGAGGLGTAGGSFPRAGAGSWATPHRRTARLRAAPVRAVPVDPSRADTTQMTPRLRAPPSGPPQRIWCISGTRRLDVVKPDLVRLRAHACLSSIKYALLEVRFRRSRCAMLDCDIFGRKVASCSHRPRGLRGFHRQVLAQLRGCGMCPEETPPGLRGLRSLTFSELSDRKMARRRRLGRHVLFGMARFSP